MFGGQEGQEVREEVHWHWLGSIQKVGHPRRHFHNDCVKLQWHWESNKPLITTPFPALTTQASRRQWWRIKSKCLRKSRECSESPANKCWVCKMCCQSRTPANWWSNFSLGISLCFYFSLQISWGLSMELSNHNASTEDQGMTYLKQLAKVCSNPA